MYIYSHRTKDGAVYESEVKKRGAARRAYIKARSSGQTTGQIRQRYTKIFLRYSRISPLAHSLESGSPIILVPHHPNPLSRWKILAMPLFMLKSIVYKQTNKEKLGCLYDPTPLQLSCFPLSILAPQMVVNSYCLQPLRLRALWSSTSPTSRPWRGRTACSNTASTSSPAR